MGYDVTYHPITREKMFEWYFEPLRDDTTIDRVEAVRDIIKERLRRYNEMKNRTDK